MTKGVNPGINRCEMSEIVPHDVFLWCCTDGVNKKSTKISNDQEPIQSDPISLPQNQKGNN